ncbi:hypothetical protein PAMP_017051 [Pampus punctatissimus]
MLSLYLSWTLLIVSLWTSGLCQNLQQKTLNVLYPKINDTETIDCDCYNFSCDSVHWFRTVSNHSKIEYLGNYNKADRRNYADKEKEKLFKFSIKGGTSFSLRFISVTKEDTGIYSCILKDRKKNEMWRPGVLLLPGVPSPTLPPMIKPKKPAKPGCRCPKKNISQNGCSSLVLWPLVGVIAGLALAVICTLYYFSRLPKKCRHRLVK